MLYEAVKDLLLEVAYVAYTEDQFNTNLDHRFSDKNSDIVLIDLKR